MNGSNHARALEPSSSRVHPFDLGSVSDDVTRGGLRGSCITINQTESIFKCTYRKKDFDIKDYLYKCDGFGFCLLRMIL